MAVSLSLNPQKTIFKQQEGPLCTVFQFGWDLLIFGVPQFVQKCAYSEKTLYLSVLEYGLIFWPFHNNFEMLM